MLTAYYNEIDPYAAQWLRNLIAANLIAPGDVDERSIVDVQPDDLKAYSQCHFFAGIGGWSCALRLAGWPDNRPVWTGSCPCQPFSAAGKGAATDDERHLWPQWFPLIAERRPPIVLGEQVEAAIRRGWLDAVFADLEGQGYACGASVLPACGVGAPHIRQRVWFVADASGERRQQISRSTSGNEDKDGRAGRNRGEANGDHVAPGNGKNSGMANAEHPIGRSVSRSEQDVGDGDDARRPQTHSQSGTCSQVCWTNAEWLSCTDGKARPVEPGTFPLAHGVSARVGKLRAYGNAIVPQVAAEFVSAFLEING
jgi:DNA (cytosine-5)-methyltransferase 1